MGNYQPGEGVNTIMPMSIPTVDCRKFYSSTSEEHIFFRNFSNGSNKGFQPKRPLYSSRKLKPILGFVVTTVILVSFFAFFSFADTGIDDTAQNNSESVTSTITQYSANATENQTNKTEHNASFSQNNANSELPLPSPPPPSSQGLSPLNVLFPPKPLGIIGSAPVIDRKTWKAVAEQAWKYFQPVTGLVENATGLPSAGWDFPYFTDWDLGVYVQAVIDAHDIGLIERDGPWGADSRLQKVLMFLENRTLTDNRLPFWFYQAVDGKPALQFTNGTGFVADTGRLLVALRNMRAYDIKLQTRIDNVVKNRMNCSFMLTEVDTLAKSSNIYDYFVASGFAAFWPEKKHVPTLIIDNIMAAPQKSINGGSLPVSKISCEPILHSIFDLEQPDPRVFNLSRQIYLAHEGWYNATSRYRAFSEGPTDTRTFAYEWIILPDGRTWVVQDQEGSDLNISPIIYSKVAFSFLALHNTVYARNIVVYIENALPEIGIGYYDGIHEDGKNKVEITGSNTNGLIISASRYAIRSGVWP